MKTLDFNSLSRFAKRNFFWMALILVSCLKAQDPSFKIAQTLIDPAFQNKVFWVKASGSPEKMVEWTYYFYDPSTSNNARLVKVVDGKVDRFQPGDFKSKVTESLTFDPTANKVSAEQALLQVRTFAQQKQLNYDSVKMQLRRFSTNVSPTWQAELYQNSGFVARMHLNDVDGTVVTYRTTREGAEQVNGFFKDVEKTFLNIGGELEEFFTGERSVDQ